MKALLLVVANIVFYAVAALLWSPIGLCVANQASQPLARREKAFVGACLFGNALIVASLGCLLWFPTWHLAAAGAALYLVGGIGFCAYASWEDGLPIQGDSVPVSGTYPPLRERLGELTSATVLWVPVFCFVRYNEILMDNTEEYEQPAIRVLAPLGILSVIGLFAGWLLGHSLLFNASAIAYVIGYLNVADLLAESWRRK